MMGRDNAVSLRREGKRLAHPHFAEGGFEVGAHASTPRLRSCSSIRRMTLSAVSGQNRPPHASRSRNERSRATS